MAAFLQSQSGSRAAAGTAVTATYPGVCTNGSTLIAVVFWNDVTGQISLADPTNGAWTPVTPILRGIGALASFSSQMFTLGKLNTATTALTVTGTQTVSSTSARLAIHEYSGGAFQVEQAQAFNSQSGGSTVTNGSITMKPRNASPMGFAYCIFNTGYTSIAGGYTTRESANFGANGTADAVALTPGTDTNPVWTAVSGTDQMQGAAIFVPAIADSAQNPYAIQMNPGR